MAPIRFWFPCSPGIGIGVTAWSRDAAEKIARETAAMMPGSQLIGDVIENVDVQTLDQGHVIPNMGPPNLVGVWFPLLNL